VQTAAEAKELPGLTNKHTHTHTHQQTPLKTIPPSLHCHCVG